MPMTAFIGVRISWLIVARNELFASLAASAWPRALSPGVLLEQPHVLDRDDRLVGEGPRERHLLLGELAGCGAQDCETADRLALPQQRNAQRREVTQRQRQLGHARNCFAPSTVSATAMTRESRMQVACAAAAIQRPGFQKSALARSPRRRSRRLRSPSCRPWASPGRRLAAEQLLAALHDGVEYRLRVGDRSADHAQHLRRRRLLLERFLRLVEEAHVLERDHRLFGEGLAAALRGLAKAVRALASPRRSHRASCPRATSVRPASVASARQSPTVRSYSGSSSTSSITTTDLPIITLPATCVPSRRLCYLFRNSLQKFRIRVAARREVQLFAVE